MKVPELLRAQLRCPACKGFLEVAQSALRCVGECAAAYPIVSGVPIVIDEARSIFSIRDIAAEGADGSPFATRPAGFLRRLGRQMVPANGRNLKARQMYQALAAELRQRHGAPRVLVIGGGALGSGIEALLADPSMVVLETDVYLGPRASLVCDAHDIPFADGS